MADANVKVVKVVEEVTYTLTLTEEEALVIKSALGMVSGQSAQRDHVDNIYDALSDALISRHIDAATWRKSHPYHVEGVLRFDNPLPNQFGRAE